MRMSFKTRGVKRILMALVAVVVVGVGGVLVATHREGDSGENTRERVLTELVRMMTGNLRPVTDEASRKAREDNHAFVSNLLQQCGIHCAFMRLEDGTPFLFDSLSGCEGAYKDIPFQVAIDDRYVHGSAVFPAAKSGNTNMVEFVALANRMVKTGKFEYDARFGFVMYKYSMPMSAIRSRGKTALGMVYAYPVMEVDLFSEAYKDVLHGRKTPKEAIVLVARKLERTEANEPAAEPGKPSEETVGAIRKYFEDKGLPARPVKVGDRLGFAGTMTNCLSAGMKDDGYDFRLFVDEDWVCAHVYFPEAVTNRQAVVREFVARMNNEIEETGFTLVYDDTKGSVSCRSEIHVAEFGKDVTGSMFTLLRGQVEMLDRCAVAVRKIGSGQIDAVRAMKEVRGSSRDESGSGMEKTPTSKVDR